MPPITVSTTLKNSISRRTPLPCMTATGAARSLDRARDPVVRHLLHVSRECDNGLSVSPRSDQSSRRVYFRVGALLARESEEGREGGCCFFARRSLLAARAHPSRCSRSCLCGLAVAVSLPRLLWFMASLLIPFAVWSGTPPSHSITASLVVRGPKCCDCHFDVIGEHGPRDTGAVAWHV